MNMRLYQATLQYLRSEALKSLGMIESLLTNPPPLEENITELIAKHTLNLVQHEGAVHSLETYFPVSAPPPPPSQTREPDNTTYERTSDEEHRDQLPPEEEPLTVTPEMSATMRESLKRQFGDERIEEVHTFVENDVAEDPEPDDDRPLNEWIQDE